MPVPSIAFGGDISEAQFRQVQALLLGVWSRWYVLLVACLAMFITVGTGWDVVLADPRRIADELLPTALLLPVAMLVWRYGMRRNWQRWVQLQGRISGELGHDGLRWQTSINQAQLGWDKLIGHRCGPDLLLLYYAPRCAFFLPRSFFADEAQWQAALALAAERSARR